MAENTTPKNITEKANKAITSAYKTTKKLVINAISKIPSEQKQKMVNMYSNLVHSFEVHIKYDLSKIQNGDFNYCKAKFFGMLIGVIFFAMPGLFIGLIVGHFFDLSQRSDDFKAFSSDSKKLKEDAHTKLKSESSEHKK